jgi:hypothetical protein
MQEASRMVITKGVAIVGSRRSRWRYERMGGPWNASEFTLKRLARVECFYLFLLLWHP